MTASQFRTPAGWEVPAVTADEMQSVDRLAVEDVGLALLQMMEHAGRALAWHVRDVSDGPVIVVAGNGGNGGGGLACARHLLNREFAIQVVLDRPAAELTGVTAKQYHILEEMGVPVSTAIEDSFDGNESTTVVDALIGYGLDGELRPPADTYVEGINRHGDSIVSLDVPSGLDATTGESLGAAVRPDRTVTLALPKTGLAAVEGSIVLADITIPATVYDRLDIDYQYPFGESDWVRLER